ncbi:histidine triad nucleotide-binding protein [Desulfobulbus oligotrophicus]|jgi:histidine triad (HIT) family protein|uniref:Histidine triad nucleotide-binding protein n=1 Tax=Desulfobulbus oligotrophicus TaxID=1909699 RepID=A0A7T5VCV3_9BACT|nr:histidine triad nucleotide-binding protein [Desulfobulbus oligotrophicus]MDY0389647.1 histidine triad nucleotide-binding protein [Desulfobulbus oligotrophicus]QQG65477.1 histidine triad nucleotide-binding protein [Desulfobulbus oligotrophicus]
MPDNCLFCKIIRGEVPADKLYEDDEVLVFRDIAPQAPVHFLVIPKEHLTGPAAATQENERLMGKLLRIGAETAAKEEIPHFRVVANNGSQAGQTVFHLHVHILGGRYMAWPPG